MSKIDQQKKSIKNDQPKKTATHFWSLQKMKTIKNDQKNENGQPWVRC